MMVFDDFFPTGGVPEMRTGRAEKPIPSASNPSTWGGRLWTGATVEPGRPPTQHLARAPVFFRYFNEYRAVTTPTSWGDRSLLDLHVHAEAGIAARAADHDQVGAALGQRSEERRGGYEAGAGGLGGRVR